VEDTSGKRKLEGFDTIVLAIGQVPNDRVYQALKGKIAELYVIGDASQPREIIDAVYEGEEIAVRI
jgi:2-enoate reductase